MSEYISLDRTIVARIVALPSDAVKVYLALLERNEAQKLLKVGLTLNELARSCDLGPTQTKRTLLLLVDEDLVTINIDDKKMTILVKDANEPKLIPFSMKNTDETKIATIEAEMRRLEKEYAASVLKRSSNIANVFKGDEAAIIQEIEGDLGRGISQIESYLLGKSMAGFGPERVKAVWRKSAMMAKNPMRTLYAMLWRNSAGMPTVQKEVKHVNILPPKL
jgi:hypothetical protein